MKLALKVFIAVVLALAVFVGSCLFLLAGQYSFVRRNINHYDNNISKIENAAELMPDLESLTGYSDIQYRYKLKVYSTLMGFISQGVSLFVTYEEDEYTAAKDKALSEYAFLKEPIVDHGHYTLPVTEFEYKGYTMKVVPDEEYINFSACKSFMLLGFNDVESKIVYMYYYDQDHDCIAHPGENLEEEMCKLVKTAFSWVK